MHVQCATCWCKPGISWSCMQPDDAQPAMKAKAQCMHSLHVKYSHKHHQHEGCRYLELQAGSVPLEWRAAAAAQLPCPLVGPESCTLSGTAAACSSPRQTPATTLCTQDKQHSMHNAVLYSPGLPTKQQIESRQALQQRSCVLCCDRLLILHSCMWPEVGDKQDCWHSIASLETKQSTLHSTTLKTECTLLMRVPAVDTGDSSHQYGAPKTSPQYRNTFLLSSDVSEFRFPV
jgi:hypothetical protein